jgi:membrane protein DedA with SNARE-associated domain
MLAPAVLDPSHLFQHLGYAAILVIVLLGNAGVPAPEESVLVLGGYLAWHGRLHLPLVIIVGVVSASLGDNLGFWVGRRYGPRAVARLLLPPARVAQAQALMARYGARAIFAARFVPGLRTVARPLAGAGGLPPLRFLAANLLGAICHVPPPVLAGYGVGYGLGDWVERLRRAVSAPGKATGAGGATPLGSFRGSWMPALCGRVMQISVNVSYGPRRIG